MDVFEVERRVKNLISEYMQERGTDSQVISRLHLALSVDEKDALLEGVYRRYLGELRQYDRLQASTEEILFPKSRLKASDVSSQRDGLVIRNEIKKALSDLANCRFNSLEEHSVSLQRLCRMPVSLSRDIKVIAGDATVEQLEQGKAYYKSIQDDLQPRIQALDAVIQFMDRVKVRGTFRESIDYVNLNGNEVEDAIVTDLITASEELS